MNITNETITKLEKLSMLEIEDKESMKKKLSEVLTFMENLSSSKDFVVKDEQTETIYREDNVVKKDDLETFFSSNKNVRENMFNVPKVL